VELLIPESNVNGVCKTTEALRQDEQHCPEMAKAHLPASAERLHYFDVACKHKRAAAVHREFCPECQGLAVAQAERKQYGK